jgi:hypothetical protein
LVVLFWSNHEVLLVNHARGVCMNYVLHTRWLREFSTEQPRLSEQIMQMRWLGGFGTVTARLCDRKGSHMFAVWSADSPVLQAQMIICIDVGHLQWVMIVPV